MQYDDTGYATFKLDEFTGCMGVPESYRPKDIKTKVIEPAIKMLKEKKLFEEITFDTNKAHRQGNEITGFDFNFKVAANDEMTGQQKFKIGTKNELSYQQYKPTKNSFKNYPQNGFIDSDLEAKLLDN